jgi:hypothetical protein
MQTITQYQQDNHIRLLLQGPPGSGKSTLACQFPSVYVADCDVNLAGPLRFLQKNNKTIPIGYDLIDRNGEGPVPLQNRWERLITCLNTALKDPAVGTIVIDSATKLSDYIRYKILGSGRELESLSQPQWGTYFLMWKQLIGRLIEQPKHFILLAHETVETDVTNQHLKHFISIPGQTRFVIGALFTDIWRCEVDKRRDGNSDKFKYHFVVRTMPDMCYNLKNSLGLEPILEFDWSKVEDKL